jgi:glycerophosphoryl diester phosphodiesterase
MLQTFSIISKIFHTKERKKAMLNYKNKVSVAAHRGNSRYYPENTMAAFRSAVEIGADMIETDVHMTKDGALVLMHDDKVDRTTNGTGFISDMTLDEIRALDAGSHKDEKFRGERVPLLTELLELVKDTDILLNIEFKDYVRDERDPESFWEFSKKSADKIIATLKEYGVYERCVMNSWSGVLLEYINSTYPDAKIHAYSPQEYMGLGQKRNLYDYAYCVCLWGTPIDPVLPEMIYQHCKNTGVEPWVYYNKENAEIYDLAIERGAVLITANDPVWVMDYLRAKGLHN